MNGKRANAIRHIDTLFGAGAIGALTDVQLLERFTSGRDETAELAFAALVERHGPMVLRVCRVVLRDSHDAQDAFQATFLVLIRRARSLWVRDSLGPWLHRVAYRVASGIRSADAMRQRHERLAAPRASSQGDGLYVDELGDVIQEEVDGLPERHRAAVVLCLMEGLTPEQAARSLNCPVGTVHSRLARGRERLRGRLARRGLAPGIAGLTLLITGEPASAMVPAAIVHSTVQTAMRFAARRIAARAVSAAADTTIEGLLRAIMMTRIKMACGAALLLGVVLMGARGLSQAQSGLPLHAQGPPPGPRMKYEIHIWKDGQLTGKPILVEAFQGEPVRFDTPDGPLEIRRAPLSDEDRRKNKVRDTYEREADEHRHEAAFLRKMVQGIQEYRAANPADDKMVWIIHSLGYRVTPQLDHYLADSINYHMRQAARLDALAAGRKVISPAESPPVAPPIVPLTK